MTFRLAADAVLILHLAFIVFVVFGAMPTLRWRRFPAIHLPAAAWGVYVEANHRICPLTYLENQLRHMAGQAGYKNSFIEHYLLNIIYPVGLTPEIQYLLAAAVLLINLAIYGWLICHRHKT
jgi:hypothetical protein